MFHIHLNSTRIRNRYRIKVSKYKNILFFSFESGWQKEDSKRVKWRGEEVTRVWNRYTDNIRGRTICPVPKFKFPGRLCGAADYRWRRTWRIYIYIYIGWLTSMPIDARSASPLAPFSARPWSTDNLLRFKRREAKRCGLDAKPLLLPDSMGNPSSPMDSWIIMSDVDAPDGPSTDALECRFMEI